MAPQHAIQIAVPSAGTGAIGSAHSLVAALVSEGERERKEGYGDGESRQACEGYIGCGELFASASVTFREVCRWSARTRGGASPATQRMTPVRSLARAL